MGTNLFERFSTNATLWHTECICRPSHSSGICEASCWASGHRHPPPPTPVRTHALLVARFSRRRVDCRSPWIRWHRRRSGMDRPSVVRLVPDRVRRQLGHGTQTHCLTEISWAESAEPCILPSLWRAADVWDADGSNEKGFEAAIASDPFFDARMTNSPAKVNAKPSDQRRARSIPSALIQVSASSAAGSLREVIPLPTGIAMRPSR